MDTLIFGDNQFFGINHMSEERGMESARRFQDTNEIIKVIDVAYDSGIHAFTFSTHDRVKELCDHFRNNPDRYADLRLYPTIPYAHKYANLVNEKGVLGALRDTILGGTPEGLLKMASRGGSAVLTQKTEEIMKLLINLELQMFHKLTMKVVFLQNIVTDLLLGLGWYDLFAAYAEFIEKEYKITPGFITLNLPLMLKVLDECNIKNAVVCSAINKNGFQMSPDVPSYVAALDTYDREVIAMSFLAGGSLSPNEAIDFVANLPHVNSFIFGASSRAHILQIKELVGDRK